MNPVCIAQKGRGSMSKMEEILSTAKLNELIKKNNTEDKKKNALVWIMAIIGVVVAIAAIVYAIYRFLTPDYLEDFEDDFDDEFDDDFFDDDDEEEDCGCGACASEKTADAAEAQA
jgi:flagellar basal body-associated protein FliL